MCAVTPLKVVWKIDWRGLAWDAMSPVLSPPCEGGGGEGGRGGGADSGVHQTATIQRRVLPAVLPARLAQSEAIFTYIRNG